MTRKNRRQRKKKKYCSCACVCVDKELEETDLCGYVVGRVCKRASRVKGKRVVDSNTRKKDGFKPS